MLAIDPKATYKVVLENYKHLPPDQQPVFELRYLSIRDWKKVSALSDELDNTETGEAGIAVAIKAIKKGLVGWINVTDGTGKSIPFDIKKVEDVFLAPELTELMRRLINQKPNFDDKKKSGSQ